MPQLVRILKARHASRVCLNKSKKRPSSRSPTEIKHVHAMRPASGLSRPTRNRSRGKIRDRLTDGRLWRFEACVAHSSDEDRELFPGFEHFAPSLKAIRFRAIRMCRARLTPIVIWHVCGMIRATTPMLVVTTSKVIGDIPAAQRWLFPGRSSWWLKRSRDNWFRVSR